MELSRIIRNNSGQTLIEAIVAIVILIVILTAASVSIVSSISNSVYERDQALATKYAQEGIEYVRQYKIGNPTNFNNYNNPRCLTTLPVNMGNLPTPPAGGCAVIAGTNFRRYATFTTASSSCDVIYPDDVGATPVPILSKSVVVTVEWRSGKCSDATDPYCNKVEIESCY